MDVLDKCSYLITENYAIRKNQGINRSLDVGFRNFMQNARMSCDMTGVGLKNDDLLIIFRHFLNSILMRSGKPMISGGQWDMTVAHIIGYSSMGTDFSDEWDKNVVPAVMDYRYRYTNGATRSAGLPVCTTGGNVELTARGIRVGVTSSTPPYRVSFAGVEGLGSIRSVGYYFSPSTDGAIVIGGANYGVFSSTMGNDVWRYTSRGGEVQLIVEGEVFVIHEGVLTLTDNAAGCWDIDVHVKAVNMSGNGNGSVQVIPAASDASWGSGIPEQSEMPDPMRAVMTKFVTAYCDRDDYGLLVAEMGQTLMQKCACVINCLVKQL